MSYLQTEIGWEGIAIHQVEWGFSLQNDPDRRIKLILLAKNVSNILFEKQQICRIIPNLKVNLKRKPNYNNSSNSF